MTLPALCTADFEWPSGRSSPAGQMPQSVLKSRSDLAGSLALFLLEGAHTTLRGSRREGRQNPRKSRLLPARTNHKLRAKALLAANTARHPSYSLNRSMACPLLSLHRSAIGRV